MTSLGGGVGGGALTSSHTNLDEPRPCEYCDTGRALDEISRQEELHALSGCRYCCQREAQQPSVNTVSDTYQHMMTAADDDNDDDDAAADYVQNGTSNNKNNKLRSSKLSRILLRKPKATPGGKTESADDRSRNRQRMTNQSADYADSVNSTIPEIRVTQADVTSPAERSASSSPVWRKRESVIMREERQRLEEQQALLQEQRSAAASGRCSTIESVNRLADTSFISSARDVTAATTAAAAAAAVHSSSDVIDNRSPARARGVPASKSKRRRSDVTTDTTRRRRSDITTTNDNDRTYIPRLEIECPKKAALVERRQMVVEWQTIAAVVDRLLFWIFLLGTLVAYVVILYITPRTKPVYKAFDDGYNILRLQPNIYKE